MVLFYFVSNKMCFIQNDLFQIFSLSLFHKAILFQIYKLRFHEHWWLKKLCLDWNNDHCILFLFSSQAGVESKTTFDDLLESLKQLEEEPAGLIPVEESTEHKFGGWSKCLCYNFMIGGTQWANVSKYIRRALNGFLYALEASLVNLEQPNYLHVSVWMF